MAFNHKKSILFLIACFSIISLYAQNTHIEFVYDHQTGNRIERRVITLKNQNIGNNNGRKVKTVKYEDFFKNVEVTIYPNPNGGKFKIKLVGIKNGQKANLILYTVNGQLVFRKTNVSNITAFDIQNRENGSYILNLEINGKIKSWRIIKI